MDKTFEENMIAVYLIELNSNRVIEPRDFPLELRGVVATRRFGRMRKGLDPVTGKIKD